MACSIWRAALEGEECGVADEEGSVGLMKHGDGIGGRGEEGGIGGEEAAEEELGVGEGAARGGVGGDGGRWCGGWSRVCGDRAPACYDELDGADAVERGDGAAGDDGEIGRERGDGDEAEVGAAVEELVGAEGGGGGVELVALGEGGGGGGCSKSHMSGAGLRKWMAATRRRVEECGAKTLV